MKSFVFLLFLSGSLLAAASKVEKGKLLSYNQTHFKMKVGDQVKSYPIKSLHDKYKHQIDRYLGKEIEIEVPLI